IFASSATPALAEVVEAHDDHFITRAEAIVDADRKATWLALISPARWWSSEHTWSADAANLRLTPQAGGCFCETIPEAENASGFTLEGSVEHMRVIQAYPEVALRMSGALGPLQSEPVTGILTIAISEADVADDGSARTRIVWEYNVGGKMRYPVPVISQAVDGIMTLQLTGLAEQLGLVEMPAIAPAPPAAEPVSPDEPEGDEAGEDAAPEAIDPDQLDDQVESEDVMAEPEGPSVDDAFGDLSDAPNQDEVSENSGSQP
ncbi:MAG: hypothetical protein AAFY42_00360, partial [Pseudomonadota bacterium]